ncbi:MAG: hypothetical protein FJ100_03910 [Deltaproteobacteria bacterium]|nr:hypothetical protein [Deltaproteobacteria bacterium]
MVGFARMFCPLDSGRRRLVVRALRLAAWGALAAGCVEEATVTLPAITNEVRNRSVRVDASKLVTTAGTLVDIASLKPGQLVDYTADCRAANCAEFKPAKTDGVKVASMMSVGGTAKAVIPTDESNPALFTQSVKSLYAETMRIPTGYGCKAMMQGLFPDRTKDVNAIENYKLEALDALIQATREVNAFPVWTVGYDLGTAGKGCVYENGDVKGEPIQDVAKWAKAAARIAHWYDFDLPAKKKDPKGPDPLCVDPKITSKPWYCSHTIVNIEFLRDPFGAGGYKKENKQAWLDAYKAFALEMRLPGNFALPQNDVRIIAPSVVIKSDLEVQDPTSPNRSPIFDFIDRVVAGEKDAQGKVQPLPLSALSLEIEASTPSEARQIVNRVAEYAASKGLKHEKGLFGSDGTAAIPIWVMDLKIKALPTAVAPLADPKSTSYDLQRLAAWRGGFITATKMLWQGLVSDATIGSVVRVPTVDPAVADTITLAQNARESDYLWYSQAKIQSGALKPSAWPGFWFHRDHMGGEQLVSVQHGPDALGISSKQSTDQDAGIVAMATRTSCVGVNKEPIACVADASDTPTNATFYTKGKKNILRILVTDFQNELRSGKEVLEHKLRVQVDGLPADAKVAGFKVGWIDGTAATWTEILYREQGFADITNGSLSFTRLVPVPSVQYFELYF